MSAIVDALEAVEKRVIGKATLYRGDSLALSRAGHIGACDSLVTDPPYALQNDFGVMDTDCGTRTLQFDFDDKNATGAIVECLQRCAKLATNSAVTFCGTEQAGEIARALRASRMVAKHAVWIKPYPPPPAKGNWWPSAHENIVYAYRPGAFFGDDSKYRCNVFVADTLRYGRAEKCGHPTQKPVELVKFLVRSVTPPGGCVLDPYMGSGTTAVAALSLGHSFVGCEISQKYFDIACRRVELFYENGGDYAKQRLDGIIDSDDIFAIA